MTASDECETDPPLDAPSRGRSLPVLPPDDDARVEPKVRGERVLRVGSAAFDALDRAIDRVLPEAWNPFAQAGAIANTTFIVAIVSGVLVLFWYRSSVHEAHASVAAMDGARWTSGFVRSIHRYSSDACMLFVALHALKLFFARRFGGARWLAWITGAILIGTLWLVGWLGYWLVWDERARQVVLGTARMLDALPIFADPLSRGFLSDDGVSSLLFFVIFFVHMLIPLAMGIALWLHITRLSRSRFLTDRRMTAWVVGTLVVMSLVLPATTAAPAHMNVTPSGFRIDAWYLLPIALTDRLGAGALWAIALVAGILVYSVPWLLARGRARVAVVEGAKCNACYNCSNDCPYDAIQMVPRTDGRSFPAVAEVDASKCIGCGICAGSCDSAGIGLPWFDVVARRAQMDLWIDRALARDGSPLIAFVCDESAGAGIAVDHDSGACDDLAGYCVMRVPCVGWVHALTVERAIRHGASGVLIVACGPGACMYREGPKWTKERMTAAREPGLNLAKVDPKRVRVIELFRNDRRALAREADALRRGLVAMRSRARGVASIAGVALAVCLAAVTWAASSVSYALPSADVPKLVVSFKHPGQIEERCRERSQAELDKLPPHMRQPKVCERARADVRMRVFVDGRMLVDRRYTPAGVWKDGNSLAIERLDVPPGEHLVQVTIGDSADEQIWGYTAEKTLQFDPRSSHTVLFDKLEGFQWR